MNKECETCEGKGEKVAEIHPVKMTTDCPDCNGTGKKAPEGGQGLRSQDKLKKFKINYFRSLNSNRQSEVPLRLPLQASKITRELFTFMIVAQLLASDFLAA